MNPNLRTIFFLLATKSYIIIGMCDIYMTPGAGAQSDARRPGMRMVVGSILTSGNIFSWSLVMKWFLWPFSPFHWFKKGSCHLLVKEWALSTGKPPRRHAQEQCG